MPIKYEIDHAQRLVLATPHDVVTDADFFGYQQTVWSRPDVIGYNELVDMTAVTRVDFVSGDRLSDLAKLSASMDPLPCHQNSPSWRRMTSISA